jgi:CheY-like chemotaxis protein
MKILVVNQSAPELLLIAGHLRELGHDVRTAANRKEGVAALGQGLPHFVVLDLAHPDSGALELARLLRGLDTPHYVYILMLTGDVPEERLLPGYEAGGDNHARKPVTREMLAARLRAAERIAAFAAGTKRPAAEPARSTAPSVVVKPPAAAPAPPANGHASRAVAAAAAPAKVAGKPDSDSAAVDQVAATNSWRSAPASLSAVTGEFFPVPISLADGLSSGAAPTVSTTISLANPQQQLELRVMLATGEASARTLCGHLFGEDNLELAADMLSELANTLMGSLKSSFGKDSVAFTGGIPKPGEMEKFDRWYGRCEHQQQFVLKTDDAEVLVRLGLRSKMNIVVPVSKLREDMVIAKDILHVNGSLILPGGTRLSATTAERVRKMVPNASVELMDPDDVLDYLADRPSA